jgi:hypothetical protein
MSNLFSFLFSSSTEPADGLIQSEREALLDLFHFCMCADQKLLPVESASIADELIKFHWEPGVKYENFATQSLHRAQAAMATPEARKSALQQISNRLISVETKTRALATCTRIFKADGDFASAEREVFVEIKQALNWPA